MMGIKKTIILALFLLLFGCSQKDAAPWWLLTSLKSVGNLPQIEPTNTSITYTGNGPASITYSMTIDGKDVTGDAQFSLSKPEAGSFTGSELTISGSTAGPLRVIGTVNGRSVETGLTVFIDSVELFPGAPPNSMDLFENATGSGEQSITVVYPQDQTMIPNNVSGLDVHWKDSQTEQLFEATVSNEFVRIRKYLTQASGQNSWFILDADSTRLLTQSGKQINIVIKGLSGMTINRSAQTKVIATGSEWSGRVFADSYSQSQTSVLSRDLATNETSFTTFYSDATSGGRCIGCHAVSQDSNRLAFTYDQGIGNGGLLNATTMTVLPENPARKWTYASFSPDGSRLVTAFNGILTLRNFSDGSSVADLPTEALATQPAFSRDGKYIAFVTRSSGNDIAFTDGTIKLAEFDSGNGTLSNAITLVVGNGNNFDPSFSPDGKWLLFTRISDNTSNYASLKSELWVVKTDGSSSPIRLNNANLKPMTSNSSADWSPTAFLGPDGERIYWILFTSRRDFGVRLENAQKPQIWATAFFPVLAEAGLDPSTPAFWLNGQQTSNLNLQPSWQ
ncbi:MAG: hypothetical protein F9K24_20275 [Leptonema illini]|uniref:WD40-like beta Propeller containing protein n=2 Tax=Leptonema illini TaxID=183 RepID=H2CKA9_9LEPT|nr:PD40 domain-containing protein [Leptonema illini]EHQ07212.1 WD40-like beta Propeller containing protein [Leptonema illini DSM 21528]KAB2929331.1 MAG: hypothetical protein F9K24_20275 [Leptonema illini]